jgi:hexosaminidase
LKNLNEECGSVCNLPSENEIFVKIVTKSTSLKLYSETDESYQLNITNSGKRIAINILSETPFGARHGLETLSQMVAKNSDEMQRSGLVIISSAIITDRPFFNHRGLLVDTARHFIPISSLLRILDGMAVNKMNIFHWHITDSQSFPMETKSKPQMTHYGAYSFEKFYRESEITALVKYAKYRGIRVIFELDGPSHVGHGWEWGPKYGLGDLAVCVDNQPWRKFCIQPNCGQLNVANANIYSVLKDIYSDIFNYQEKSEIFHMGGDEVFIDCWNQTKEITDYMKNQNYDPASAEGFLKLWAEYQDQALKTWDKITQEQLSVIVWSSEMTLPENIEKYLSKDRYIVQTWVPDSSDVPMRLLEKGYRIIFSTKNAWYFDHGFWGSTKYYNWKTVYANTLPNHPLVLGGEVCMWSEYVDEHSIEMKIFPRLNAAAERLWTNPSMDAKYAESRFNRQRERIIAKKIRADATTPEYCSIFEGECK